MQVSVTEAKGQLTELVRRAEAGDEVIPRPARLAVAKRKAPPEGHQRGFFSEETFCNATRLSWKVVVTEG